MYDKHNPLAHRRWNAIGCDAQIGSHMQSVHLTYVENGSIDTGNCKTIHYLVYRIIQAEIAINFNRSNIKMLIIRFLMALSHNKYDLGMSLGCILTKYDCAVKGNADT